MKKVSLWILSNYDNLKQFQEWNDDKLCWEPSEYGGVEEIYVPSEIIWLPDIILYNK